MGKVAQMRRDDSVRHHPPNVVSGARLQFLSIFTLASRVRGPNFHRVRSSHLLIFAGSDGDLRVIETRHCERRKPPQEVHQNFPNVVSPLW